MANAAICLGLGEAIRPGTGKGKGPALRPPSGDPGRFSSPRDNPRAPRGNSLFAEIPSRHYPDHMARTHISQPERRALVAVSNAAAVASHHAKAISEDALVLIRCLREGTFDKTEDLPALRESFATLQQAITRLGATLDSLDYTLEGSLSEEIEL